MVLLQFFHIKHTTYVHHHTHTHTQNNLRAVLILQRASVAENQKRLTHYY